MEENYTKISELVQSLLIPAKTEKKIDNETFEKFYSILLELEEKLKGEDYIPRKIAGLLFFISNSLTNEANYCDYKDELFMAAAKTEDMVDRILWDSPFKR